MSYRIVDAVFEHGPSSPTAKLALAALATFANAEGIAWPSVATLASKASLTRRAAQSALRRLQENGWFVALDGVRHRSRRYRIVMEKLSRDADDGPPGANLMLPRCASRSHQVRTRCARTYQRTYQ